MNKLILIKKIIGQQIYGYGFEYFKSEPNTWVFKRTSNEIEQYFAIYESYYQQAIRLELYTSLDINNILEIRDFYPYWTQKYGETYFWEYTDKDSFIKILNEFVDIFIDYGTKALDEISIQSIDTLIDITPEMQLYLFENHNLLSNKFTEKYKLSVDKVKDAVVFIIKLMKENKANNYTEIKDLLIEMSAYYGDSILKLYRGQWIWDDKGKNCLLEINKTTRKLIWTPLHNIISSWEGIEEAEEYLLQLYEDLESID